jgi:hypothetical protein
VRFRVSDNATTDDGPRLQRAWVVVGGEEIEATYVGGDLFRAVIPPTPETTFSARAEDLAGNASMGGGGGGQGGGGAGGGGTAGDGPGAGTPGSGGSAAEGGAGGGGDTAEDGGCDCASAGRSSSTAWAAGLLLLGLALRRRAPALRVRRGEG